MEGNLDLVSMLQRQDLHSCHFSASGIHGGSRHARFVPCPKSSTDDDLYSGADLFGAQLDSEWPL